MFGERYACDEQHLLDRLNKAPMEQTEAMAKGIAFEACLQEDGKYTHSIHPFPMFSFPPEIVNEMRDVVRGGIPQQFLQFTLETPNYTVRFYGYADFIKRHQCIDVKTGKQYAFPKFLDCYQHKMYLLGAKESGANLLEHLYLITDFKNVYKELYTFNKKEFEADMISRTTDLVHFIELRRSLITNPKIFA